MVMVLDLMHVHNFHWQMVNGVKMLLFLVLIVVLLRMLITRNKISYVFGEGPTERLDDTTTTTETKLSVTITKSNILLILPNQKRKFVKSALQWKQQFLEANGIKICQFKTEDSEIKPRILN